MKVCASSSVNSTPPSTVVLENDLRKWFTAPAKIRKCLHWPQENNWRNVSTYWTPDWEPCITFIKSSWFKTKRALSRLVTAPAGRGVKRRVSDDEMKRAVLHFYAGLELCFLSSSLQSLSGNLVLTLSFGWILCMVNVFHSNVRVDMLVSYSFWSKVDNEVRCSYEAIPDQHWNLNRQLLETTVLGPSMVT